MFLSVLKVIHGQHKKITIQLCKWLQCVKSQLTFTFHTVTEIVMSWICIVSKICCFCLLWTQKSHFKNWFCLEICVFFLKSITMAACVQCRLFYNSSHLLNELIFNISSSYWQILSSTSEPLMSTVIKINKGADPWAKISDCIFDPEICSISWWQTNTCPLHKSALPHVCNDMYCMKLLKHI